MEKLTTTFLGTELLTPIAVTSGIGPWGYAEWKHEVFADFATVALIAIKGITLRPYPGNCEPRIVKLTDGMINAIGLDNQGYDYFYQVTLPEIRKANVINKVIVNINGTSEDEFYQLATYLNEIEDIKFIEVNLSCPNIKAINNFFHDLVATKKFLTTIRTILTKKKLIIKLAMTLNIQQLAIICEAAKVDAIALINSVPATHINIMTQKPTLGFKTGGLSGKRIMPIALWAVYQVYQVVKTPLIGIGGISSAEDAIAFFLAGASIISIGSTLLNNRNLITEIKNGLITYLDQHQFQNISDIIGRAHE